MSNLNAIFKCDCMEDGCTEPTKKVVGVQSVTENGTVKYAKRYVCRNDDCPKRMSYLTKLGLPENRFRS